MKSVGIICEYNPFHNGHLYHLNSAIKEFKDHVVVLVLSGNFTQRGDASLINKWDKAAIALKYGVDLVIELPYAFATQSADIFAKGSIEILNHLQVENLVFGSESNNLESLIKLADIQINNKEYENIVKTYMNEGKSYPNAALLALNDMSGISINTPNDILGISYIREIKKLKSNMNPMCIKRTNDYHSENLDSDIVSATSIRKALKKNIDINTFVPGYSHKFLINNLHFIDDYFDILKYKILTEIDNLNIYQTVDEGIENRIKKYILKSNSLEELIMNVKTKRYTYNKLKRMFTHILCNFKKEEAKNFKHIEYIRILGFSKLGREYLNKIKKDINVPLVTNFSKLKNNMLDLDYRATCVYASILKEKDKINLIESEFKNKPLIR